jgi:O-antigen ligase
VDRTLHRKTRAVPGRTADRESENNATRLIGRVVFYGLLLLLALTAIPYGTVEPWSVTLFQCAVFAFGLLFVVEGYLSASWRIGGASIFFPLVGLAMFALVQSIPFWQTSQPAASSGKIWLAISADPYESRAFALQVSALILAGALMLRYLRTRRRLFVLVSVVMTVSLASAVFGILRQSLQHQPKGFVLPALMMDLGYAQFINKNHFAFLMEMALGLGIGLICSRFVSRDRILIWLAGLLAIWTALVLSGSRGGLLAMTGQFVFALLVFLRGRTGNGDDASKSKRGSVWNFARSILVQLVLIIGLVVVVIVGIIWISGDPLVTGVETVSIELQATASDQHVGARRRDIWSATWKMFKANPVAGAGLGGYWAAVPRYHDGSGQVTPQQAHNDYLELLASGGVIGFAIGLWFLIVLVKKLRAGVRAEDPLFRGAAWGAAIAIVGVAVHSLFDFGLHITINALVFCSLLAMIAATQEYAGRAGREF